MELVTAPTKVDQVAGHLRQQILSGQLAAGSRLATVRQLEERLSVSRNVVSLAYDVLDREKLIERRGRRGVFVSDWRSSRTRNAAIIVETKGHLYERQFQQLIASLQGRNYLTFTIDLNELIGNKSNQALLLDTLASRELDGLIVDGRLEFPLELLTKLQDELPRVVFMNRYEHPEPIDASYVLIGYEEGCYLATRELLAKGRRDILFIIHDPGAIYRDGDYGSSSHHHMLSGYRRAMREAGARERVLYYRRTDWGRIGEESVPEAIVASADNVARQAIDHFQQRGVRVPEEMSVIGFYDTPWARLLSPTLSTICVQEEEIARIAEEKIEAESRESSGWENRVVVRPKLIHRESTG